LFCYIAANDHWLMFMLLSLGVDLITGVTCDALYEWSDKTDSEWEFKKNQSSETFHVSIVVLPSSLLTALIKTYLAADVG
jgi:uncharacterized membrane protein